MRFYDLKRAPNPEGHGSWLMHYECSVCGDVKPHTNGGRAPRHDITQCVLHLRTQVDELQKQVNKSRL